MNIENNLIDPDNYPDSHNLFALNIILKSSSILYLEDLTQGEMDDYIKYFNSNREDTMIIKNGDTLWRILPSDVERVSVSSYPQKSFQSSKIGKALFADSAIPTSMYIRVIKLSIIWMVINFILVGVKIFTSGKPFDTLVNKELLALHISKIINGANFAFFAAILVMAVMNIIDFMFETGPKYTLAKEYQSNDGGRLNNLITMIVYIVIGYLLIFAMSAVFHSIFLK